MKRIDFTLSNGFYLKNVNTVQLFELENNTCEIAVKTQVTHGMAYELHFECEGEKTRILGEIDDNTIKCLLPASLLKKKGALKMQLRGITEDERAIESNAITFEVGEFINATHEPTPEEESEIERLFVRVTELEEKEVNLTAFANALDANLAEETKLRMFFDTQIHEDLTEEIKERKQQVQEQDELINQLADAMADKRAVEVLQEQVGEFASDLEDETKARHDAESAIDADIEELYALIRELKNSNIYSAIPIIVGKWIDNKPIYRRVYAVNSGIAKGNTIDVAAKPANMALCIRAYGVVVGTAAANNVNTNSDVSVWVNELGVKCVNNFTGYAERLYIILEYTVNE